MDQSNCFQDTWTLIDLLFTKIRLNRQDLIRKEIKTKKIQYTKNETIIFFFSLAVSNWFVYF